MRRTLNVFRLPPPCLDDMAATLKRSACTDAFICALNARRVSEIADPAAVFEAHLGVTARRHPKLAAAWTE
eukprot:3198704-Pyramimonas_sp.AAC.1